MAQNSSTKENYIKALYHLHLKNEDISLSDLGKELDVSKPSANDMIRKLKEEGVVMSERYKPIRLTELGIKTAAAIIRKHRLSEMFLSEIMNFGWEEVHDIAEELEHIKVDKFFDRMDELLGFPAVDPHGSPIPDKNGHITRPEYRRLIDVQKDETVMLKALKNSSAELLKYLNKRDIKLGTTMRILQVEAFDGSLLVLCNDSSELTFTKEVSEHLLVQ